MKPGLSQGIPSLIESRCGYTGLSYFTYLSRMQEQFAKTVTNLLILLSVLVKVLFCFVMQYLS